MLYETKLIDGKAWRVVIEADDLKMIGVYKCQCGTFIKKEENLTKHLETPSHKKNIEWLALNRPDRQQAIRFLSKQ